MFKRLKWVFSNYGELILRLAVKNLKVQYKHAALGFLWSLVVPLAMTIVFWVIFGLLFKGMRGEGIGPLFLVAALFPWTFVQMSVSMSTSCIPENRDIIRKVYFPKEIVPFSIIGSNLVNFLISMILLIVLVIGKRIWAGEVEMITISYLALPLLVVLTVILASGVSLIAAYGQVYYRDVRYIVEIGLLVWFYFSGVFYQLSLFRDHPILMRLFLLNPFAALVTLYRAVFQVAEPFTAYVSPGCLIGTTIVSCIVIFLSGYLLFTWKEHEFVDLA